MHIEKNVCENIYGTLLGIEGESKDNLKARLDLQHMNIKRELHPQKNLMISIICHLLPITYLKKGSNNFAKSFMVQGVRMGFQETSQDVQMLFKGESQALKVMIVIY